MVKALTSKKVTIDAEQLNRLEQAVERLKQQIKPLMEDESKINKDYQMTKLKPSILVERNDVLLGTSALAILKYIMDNQDKYKDLDEGITKQHVAKHMDKAQLLSRPTTLKLIEELINHKIIMDDKKRDNARSRLIIHPSFNSVLIEVNLLTHAIEDIRKHFEIFEGTNAANTQLTNELLKTIENFREKYLSGHFP